MKRLIFTVTVFLFCAAFSANLAAAEEVVPRTIIALYDNKDGDVRTSLVHNLAEMPLNHLGLTIEYHEIQKPLPDIRNRPDVRGVITWFLSKTDMNNPDVYLKWAIDAMDSGKKFVVMGSFAALDNKLHQPSQELASGFFSRLGVRPLDSWVETPFDVSYSYNSSEMFLSGDSYNWLNLSYQRMQATNNNVKIHLASHKKNTRDFDSDLIVTSPAGGYAAGNYIFRSNMRGGDEVDQWLINPFEFFRLAFSTDDLPKPDTTTIAGRRIYYSHIDGDGWNNVSRIEEYRNKPTLSSEVVMEKAVKPFPDMPVTLTIIAADIDPKWAATEQSRPVAQKFFMLPQVQAGSHTYSHPFYWQFFQNKNNATNEIPYLRLYDHPTWHSNGDLVASKETPVAMPKGYSVPRAYAHEPFDINKEINGSIEEISALLPKDKKIELLTWSGNCSPWEEAVRMTREAGVQNINGGDSRFDPEYPDYASLMPIGIQVGKERQIYSSASNENTYTSLWSENFYAHQYLIRTFKNSETPMRLKPINIYYHLYSGERQSSLNALLSNINYARSQDIVPLTVNQFTRIADGFYDTRITSVGPDMWRIDNRGELQTIRFDRHSLKAVDFQRSNGVVGQRYFQGSLYVYLDAGVASPVIALKDNNNNFAPPEEDSPYLIESRWLVSGVKYTGNRLEFDASGFGAGEMVWQVPSSGRYRISIDGKDEQAMDSTGHFLKIKLDRQATHPRHIVITAITESGKNA